MEQLVERFSNFRNSWWEFERAFLSAQSVLIKVFLVFTATWKSRDPAKKLETKKAAPYKI